MEVDILLCFWQVKRRKNLKIVSMRISLLFIFLVLSGRLSAQHSVPATAEFKVAGAVKKEMRFQISDLNGFRQDTLGDVVIRNHKGEQKAVAKQLTGILLKTVLDSAGILVDKPKEYSELVITLIASDGYRNVYSWNELFNTEIGDHVYIVTAMDGMTLDQRPDRILVLSLADRNLGSRHLKG